MLEIKIRKIQDKIEVENKEHKLEKNKLHKNVNFDNKNLEDKSNMFENENTAIKI